MIRELRSRGWHHPQTTMAAALKGWANLPGRANCGATGYTSAEIRVAHLRFIRLAHPRNCSTAAL